MANLTLLDLVTLQNNDTLTGLVEDVTTLAPEFETFSAISRPGTYYYVLRRTALPSGGFRNVNDGVTPTKSTYKKEVKEMFFLDMPIVVDESIIKADDGSTGSVWQHEAAGVLRQAGIIIGSQVWYGTSADAKGFAGVRAQLSGNIAAASQTSNTTSAYLCWMDPKEGCRFDVGQNGAFNLPSPMRQQVTAPSGSGSIFAWVSNLSSYIGFTVVSDKSTWAVTGIDATSKFTDVMGASLVSNIPIARRNNLRWFMNRTASYLLQAGRTAINYQPAGSTGQPAFAPKPTELEGYPITLTDSITNTETN